MDDQQPILEALRQVLEPLPADLRDPMLELAGRELSERPLVGYCWDGQDRGDVDDAGNVTRPWAYEIAKPSPQFPQRIVFAMFHWEEVNAVAAFTVEMQEVEGGKMAVHYFREIIFAPKIISGPLSPKALANEFAAFMGDPGDDPEPAPRVNGRAHP